MAGGSYYKSHLIINQGYSDSPTIHFDFIAAKIVLVHDSYTENDKITWSYNGRDDEGELEFTDEKMILSGISISKIWFKSNNPSGTNIRVWAYI